MNSHVSQKRGVKARTHCMSDAVLVRQDRRNKMIPVYDPKPYRLTAVKGFHDRCIEVWTQCNQKLFIL